MLSEILDRLETGIVRFSNAITRDAASAEDYAQTARMVLVRKLPQKLASCTDLESLILWSGVVAKNAMLRELRRDKRRSRDASFEESLDVDPEHRDDDTLIESELLELVEARLRQMSVRAQMVMRELREPSERTRSIWMETHQKQTQQRRRGEIARTIKLHVVPGFVIAKSLNLSPASISRAMNEIRQALSEVGICDQVEKL
jgi:RNA polymerase sigma factor (sigma-70 family)